MATGDVPAPDLADVCDVADAPAKTVDADKSKDTNVASIEPVRIAGHSELAAQIEPAGHDKPVAHAAPANSIQDHLSEQVSQLRDAGNHEVHLTLHPPELGPVHLHLELDGDRVSVHFAVHADDARAALEQQLDPLRIRFAEMGLSLGQFDVRQEGSQHQQDDGSFLPVGPRGANLARKPYFRLAKPSGRVDVIA